MYIFVLDIVTYKLMHKQGFPDPTIKVQGVQNIFCIFKFYRVLYILVHYVFYVIVLMFWAANYASSSGTWTAGSIATFWLLSLFFMLFTQTIY